VRGQAPESTSPDRLTDEQLASMRDYLGAVAHSNAFLSAEYLAAVIGELLDAETTFLEIAVARFRAAGVREPDERESEGLLGVFRTTAPWQLGDDGRRRLERALRGLHGLHDAPAVVAPASGLTLVETVIRLRAFLDNVQVAGEALQQAVGLPHADQLGPWRRAHLHRSRRRRR
jgi:hypothetical protein